MSVDVYLIRHTRVAVDAGLCYGHLDVPLAASFDTDSARVLARLPRFDAVWSSPSTRCLQLAERLAPMSVRVDERLRELNFGTWEGRTWADIDSAEARAWGDNFVDTVCPGGESYAQLASRVGRWLLDLCDDSCSSVAAITHSGPIRALLAVGLQLPLARVFSFDIDCGSVTHMHHDHGRWTARFVNGSVNRDKTHG